MDNKKDNEQERRNKIRTYIVICAMLAIILTVSTYAWFIGLQDVRVSAFDVKISSADSLLLSLDGNKWASTILISEENYTTDAYENNTNTWGGESGLIPVSSVGQIDNAASTMKIYEKASLTASPDGYVTSTAGGYRLLASRVHNYTVEGGKNTATEQDGYVAFDLFVKNFSGTEYYTINDILNEEAIYLLNSSEVTISSNGGVPGTGIENSVRVAFVPIARVSATTTEVSKITSMNCTSEYASTEITPICNLQVGGREAQIWEPNDTAHVDGAINWYETSCRMRNGTDAADLTKKTAYSSEACDQVVDGEAKITYAIQAAVGVADKIDIYDGEDYNGYTDSVKADNEGGLRKMTYFTDSMKRLTGTSRPTFMSLAPNSITKVRVYVWIEGQDVDNYDYASAGKKISVTFGFTKERFEEEDVNYDGPVIDNARGICILHDGDGLKLKDGTSLTLAEMTGPQGDKLCTEMNGIYDETEKVCRNATYQSCVDVVGFENRNTLFVEYLDDNIELSGSTVCLHGSEPTTKSQCQARYGTWDESAKTCSGTSVEHCNAIGGYYSLGTFDSREWTSEWHYK